MKCKMTDWLKLMKLFALKHGQHHVEKWEGTRYIGPFMQD